MSYETTTTEPTQYQCRHIFTDGRRCGSPTLRSPHAHEPFCYYHHTTRGAASITRGAASITRRDPSTPASSDRRAAFTLPLPEDRSSIQHSLGQVLQMIAANEIDPRRAGLLLYGLQIASLNLKKDHGTGEKRRRIEEEDLDTAEAFVTEITHDPVHGLLAPPAELHANQPLGSAQRFLEHLGRLDDEREAEPIAADRATTQQPQSDPPQARLPQSDPPQPGPSQPAGPGNLTIDLQACAVSRSSQRTPGSSANLLAGVGTRSLGGSHETIFRMSNFIPKPASPKLSGLGPKAQKLAALREKAAAQASNAAAPATAAASAAKPKNSVARKTAFQRKAT
jgi:hypothetical protein